MTSEGLGLMFEGDSADTCAIKFPLVSMGAERRVLRAQTRERGPPSALAEIYIAFSSLYDFISQQALFHKTTRAQAQNNFLSVRFICNQDMKSEHVSTL